MHSVDLNSDIGESFGSYKLGDDEEILKYVTAANVIFLASAEEKCICPLTRQRIM